MIKINEKLSHYIERLWYEKIRYEDLLKCIDRNTMIMTDEEYNDSLQYFQNLCYEANIKFQAVREFLSDEFNLNNKLWEIDFRHNYILIDGEPKLGFFEKGRATTFSDQIEDMYDDEREFISMSRNSNHVKDITIQVTDDCNMACSYCYQHNKQHNIMTFDTAKQFIDMLFAADERTNSYCDFNKIQGVIFDFIGGEPWLNIDLINQISDYIIGEMFRRKHRLAIRFMFSICSNGLLHFSSPVQSYINRHLRHLSYNVSIDGNKKLHDSCRVDKNNNGTYDRAIAAVHDFKSKGGEIGSKMTISPNNVGYLFEAVKDLVKEQGYNHVNLNCVYEEGWNNSHALILYQQLCKLTDWLLENELIDKVSFSMLDEYSGKPSREDDTQNWCGGTGCMLALDYNGDIYPCLRYMESSTNNKVENMIIGNISSGINIEKEHQQRIKLLDEITRQSQSTDECLYCPISSGCGWCSAYNYEVFGTPNKRATFICCMHKARSLSNYYYHRKKGDNNYQLYCPKEWAIEIIGIDEYNKLLEL